MAKFSRLLFGGVIGAGLAYLFSRKDVRRRLMGGGQGQLMAPEAPRTNIPVTTPKSAETPVEEPVVEPVEEPIEEPVVEPVEEPIEEPVVEPVEETVVEPVEESVETPAEKAVELLAEEPAPETSVSAEPVAEDLESRIEETRRQVEEQLGAPFSAPAEVVEEVVEPEVAEAVAAEPVAKEEIDTGEAPEILLEEESIKAPEATTVEEQDEADIEALTEAVETNGIEIPVEPEDEFADLRTPVAGEPTNADVESSEAAPELDAGPAPSQIDRDEMRRRIDETRARLKAKAFDALVSGETFIEPETEEGHEKPEAAGIEIDSEIEQQIDRSLKEEE